MSFDRFKPSVLTLRFTALVSTIAICLCSASYMERTDTPVVSVSAETAEELRDKKQDILDKQAALEAARNELASSLDELEKEKETLMELIQLKQDEIDINAEAVAAIQAELSAKQQVIDDKAAAIKAYEQELITKRDELKERLRALSKTTSLTSTLQLLVSTDSFTDYLVQTKAMERLSEQTQTLLDNLEAEMKKLEKDKQLLEAEKTAYEAEKSTELEAQAELELAKQELDLLYSELTITTDKLHADIDKYNADIAQAEKDAAALDAKIEELILQSAGSGQSFLSGTMYWPAASCNYISSTFKFRWGRWHRGIDICGSGCYGTPINAAADGVVSYSGWMGGYGYCVMIDHGRDALGRNITTLYAHSSALLVSVGQVVQAKKEIAKIGTSGNVTGPHLHFEVRVDGTAVDPIANGYISTRGIIVDESL